MEWTTIVLVLLGVGIGICIGNIYTMLKVTKKLAVLDKAIEKKIGKKVIANLLKEMNEKNH